MHTEYKIKTLLAASAALALTLPACTSHKTHRVATVGTQGIQGEPGPAGADGAQGPQGETGAAGPQGAQGPQGSQGPQGPQGAQGAQGPQGKNGNDGNFNLGAAGALATGGLVGPNGIAGTGLLANTGKMGSAPVVLAGVQTASGETVNMVAHKGMKVATIADNAIPGNFALVGTVVGVIGATGQTLVQSGNGETYLVDGLLAAPGEFITASIGEAYLVGSSEATPFLGASILSADQLSGDVLTVGLASGGKLVTLGANAMPFSGGVAHLTDGLTGVLDHAGPSGGIISVSADAEGALSISSGVLGEGQTPILDGDVAAALDAVLGDDSLVGGDAGLLAGAPIVGGEAGLLADAPIIGGEGAILEDLPLLSDVTGDGGLLGGDQSLLGDEGLGGVVEDTVDGLLGGEEGGCNLVGGLLGGGC